MKSKKISVLTFCLLAFVLIKSNIVSANNLFKIAEIKENSLILENTLPKELAFIEKEVPIAKNKYVLKKESISTINCEDYMFKFNFSDFSKGDVIKISNASDIYFDSSENKNIFKGENIVIHFKELPTIATRGKYFTVIKNDKNSLSLSSNNEKIEDFKLTYTPNIKKIFNVKNDEISFSEIKQGDIIEIFGEFTILESYLAIIESSNTAIKIIESTGETPNTKPKTDNTNPQIENNNFSYLLDTVKKIFNS